MNPQRTRKINGYKIEEFYRKGKLVVYVDNRKCEYYDFDKTCIYAEAWPAKS